MIYTFIRMKRVHKSQSQSIQIYDPYISSVLSMKVSLPIIEVGGSIKQNLERMIVSKTEGKCIVEGFVRPDSVNILTYSAGKVSTGLVEFMTTYECMVCRPVEGMLVKCVCNTITKAGIHAEVVDNKGNTPITVFMARDHHMNNYQFERAVENAKLVVSIIGVRFELNDTSICCIGKLNEVESADLS